MAPRIHVIDDDASVRTAITRLLAAEGFTVVAHDSAESFLACDDADEHACLLVDVVMPGLDGLALQDAIAERAYPLPLIFLTGQADVPMCARAMRKGACDFLTKPVDRDALLDAIERALAKDVERRRTLHQRDTTEALLDTLTPRERQVILQVSAGRLNKQIAADLGTSLKTIKVHRGRGLEKLRVRSVADLVRLVERLRPS
jgi:FixJ family two-component response regulator